MKNPYTAMLSRSFFDITNSQIKSHKGNFLAKKYAEKWVKYVKERKKQRMILEKSRFWPGT